MRRNSPVIIYLIALLLLPSPVFAISYSGSTQLGFSNFRFSGINVTDRSSVSGHQVQANDIAGPAGHRGDGAAFFTPWRNHTEVNSIPAVVTSVTHADVSQLSTAVTMNLCCTGTTAEPYASRIGSFIANEAGNITVAIPFTLTHSGLLSPISGFTSVAGVSLFLGDLSTSAHLDATLGSGSRHGILSLTRFFAGGETGSFGFETSISAAYRSVPVPSMLWPTAIAMVGIALFSQRRRNRASFKQESPS